MTDHPQPARIVAVAQFLADVLDDLTDRNPESLSDAEADFWGCLIEARPDLGRIATRARIEMGVPAVAILETGVAQNI